MNLSEHFSYEELIASDWAARHGVDNRCPDELLPNLRRLAEGLESVRELLDAPIHITSGYRSPEVNAAIGGVATSQHCQGLAADFVCPQYGSPLQIARALAASDLDYDQCIFEFGRWVHVSFTERPRRRVLSIWTGSGGYRDGIIDFQAAVGAIGAKA